MTSLSFRCSPAGGVLTTANKKNVVAEGSALDVLDRFFDDCGSSSSQSGGAEPPRKRQRLDVSGDDDAESPPQSRIPIARVTVDFKSEKEPDHAGGDTDGDEPRSSGEAMDVGLLEVNKIEEKPARIGLRTGRPLNRVFVPRPVSLGIASPQQHSVGRFLKVDLLNELDEPTFNLLARIAQKERRSRAKPHAKGVAEAHCRLYRYRSGDDERGTRFRLECTVSWLDGQSAFGASGLRPLDQEMLMAAYPAPPDPNGEDLDETSRWRRSPKWTWSPQDFYDSVHSPAIDIALPEALNGPLLETELYPFQKRAVSWMLDREKPSQDLSHLSFTKVKTAMGDDCFVSHLQGVVSSQSNLDQIPELRGGILAEEMGLGKTCELIALLCLHKRSDMNNPDLQQRLGSEGLIPSRATLIVTPPTILQQWKDEINKHAPGLSVMHYTGIPAASKWKNEEAQVLHDFATKDVILTTYSVLAKEVHFAVDPPERSLRQRNTKRERVRSPLVRMHWWRACLDEAQMVESGVSAAARVASLLPRENAWAVSGTPLKKNVEDLFGLLIFLRYQPYCGSSAIWSRLTTQYKDSFKDIFGRIALRHTKDKIRDELRLPPQRRVVLTMPFTAIEEQNYRTLFDEMCDDIGCATDGSPLSDQWDPESSGTAETMRSWLVRLRQTCLHPQVGGRNRRALGRGAAPLRTVAEVLEVMIDQNETAVRTETRLAISGLLLKAHVIANARDDQNRSRKALEIYKEALRQAEDIVSECRSHLLGLVGADGVADTTEELDDEEKGKNPEHAARIRSRTALHSALQMQHACAFFVGTSYFQIKSNEAITVPDSDDFRELEAQEISYYDLAKVVRKELLRETSTKAENLMDKVEMRKGFTVKTSDLSTIDSPGGIENMRIVTKAEELAELLDSQAKLINEWSFKVVELLLKPLVDEDEGIETTGDEYEDSTKQQDTLYAYNDALRAIVADRNTCITGQSAPLIDHEMNMLIRDARDGKGHDPELTLKLLTLRGKLKQKPEDLVSLRGLTHEARGLETSLQWQEGSSLRATTELSILQQQMKALGKIYTSETKTLTELEKGLELFRSTMNQRLEFYRQLQIISDMVAPYKEELDETLDTHAFDNACRVQESKAKALAQLKTKQRFLQHLREESANASEAERICVICQCTFEQGVLTICGHQYCKECIQHWWKAHKTCPVCKRRLNSADFHSVTYKPQELRAQEELNSTSESSSPGRPSSSDAHSSRMSSLYSDMGSGTLAQIKSIDLNGSYGTKIDTLARHIIWLREYDAGAKCIVFSQYREFLDVLGTAFSQFGIGYSRMGKPKAIDKFKQDAGIEVFLLDAKTDSSGLNLTNAQYVFLAEPLINTAIELQAIARVHRIGQQRATTVYMYLIGDTVEEAIYDISVMRRLAHMQKSSGGSRSGQSRSATPMLGEAAIDAANSLELQQAPLSNLLVKGKGEGEVVAQDDLWGCLFGKSNTRTAVVSDDLQMELGRHLRAEAAEERRHQ